MVVVGETLALPPAVDTPPVKDPSPLAVQDVAGPPPTVQVNVEELPTGGVSGLAVNVTIGALTQLLPLYA